MPVSAVFAWFPGGEVRRISPPVGLYLQPCVQPDGTHAVFWGGATGTAGVWRVNLETFRTQRLTSMVSASWHPAYGLGGEHIVFASDRFGSMRAADMDDALDQYARAHRVAGDGLESHVFIAEADGTNWRPLTSGPYVDERPALSPDGRRVAFASNRGGNAGIWTAGTEEGSAPVPLVTDVEAYRPWWSVDGETVYFDTASGGRRRLGAVSALGGDWRALDGDDRGDTAGAYADPGGQHMLAHSTRDGPSELLEFPLDGGEPRALRPPGFDVAMHGSRARNGVVVFDAPVE